MKKGIDPNDIIIEEPDENDPPRSSGHGFRLTLGGDPYETYLVTHLPDADRYTVERPGRTVLTLRFGFRL